MFAPFGKGNDVVDRGIELPRAGLLVDRPLAEPANAPIALIDNCRIYFFD
jgi:hypothetical protein